jgi:mannosylglycerate hydrolase
MDCVLVSHFHWDREWYRTFEDYRARLIDAIDGVLDFLAADPGYRFLLDGQTVLLEDYVAIRPERRAELERGLREGRLAAGPWYVQPDMLLPSGESLVRNLLLGRRVGESFGPVSRIGYVPDSFGHPAQLPQLLTGFGIASFIHWRGNCSAIDEMGPLYRWEAPDGSAVRAMLLPEGYFNAACLPEDAEAAARGLAELAARLANGHDGPVLLMNGLDHMLPDRHTGAVADALQHLTGGTVRRGLLEDAIDTAHGPARRFRGELVGARIAPLLPGVWSTRMPVKLANRRCEILLEGWLEPWAALGRTLGVPDERPALELAWRSVVQSQAHDSICGCSLDAVDARVRTRYADAEGLATQSVTRVLERLAGLTRERRVPWTLEQDIAVFNPSPHPRTDVVRIALDPYPSLRMPLGVPEFPPILLASMEPIGFAIDDQPVRVLPSADPARPRWLPGQQPIDVELVAADVPAFGCRRYHLRPCTPEPDVVDEGGEIAAGPLAVVIEDGGTLAVRVGERAYRGLFAIEDHGDRGDTYDFDPVRDDPGAQPLSLSWRRIRHSSGIARLIVDRIVQVPAALDAGRRRRAADLVPLRIGVEARIAPGIARVDVGVTIDNTAHDHRVRLLVPTGAPLTGFECATTYDVVRRTLTRPDDTRWVHRAPATIVHQGWVRANGLTIVAPGLPEAEVTADGVIAVTLLRAVGWLARYDLRSRSMPAGPPMEVPGAQVLGRFEATLALLFDAGPVAPRDAELGLRGVLAGPAPLIADGAGLLSLAPPQLVLSAVKPAEREDGIVVRVLNPTDAPVHADLQLAHAIAGARAVRLDEEPTGEPVDVDAHSIRFTVPPHALRSVLIHLRS